MVDILISVAAFVVAIGLLVAVHEFGHFWVARRLGIRVLRFSIGFGRPIYRRMLGRDPVEFVISAIPLGGYVKMLDEREGPVPEADLHRAFNRQPVGSRMAVLVAGPAFNFLFAIVAYWLIAVIGVQSLAPVVGAVESDTPAARAGLEAGDWIVAVDDAPVQTREQALIALLESLFGDGRLELTVVAGGEQAGGARRRLALDVAGQQDRFSEPGALLPGLGFEFYAPPAVVDGVEAGGPAEQAGLRPGDRIVAIDGAPVASWVALQRLIRNRPGRTVEFEVERSDRTGATLEVRLGERSEEGEFIGYAGISGRMVWPPEMIVEQSESPLGAVAKGVGRTWEMSALTVRMLGRMVTGDVSLKNISGPINIAEYAGQTARFGLVPFLGFLAIVSISLGILNLLPIPILDGGQLVYQFIELCKGSPLSDRTLLIGQQIGIFVLLLLMSFAFYNDIARLVSG